MDKKKEIEGIIFQLDRQSALISSEPFNPASEVYHLSLAQQRKFQLQVGARIRFTPERKNADTIIAVNGRDPEDYMLRKSFDKLIAINPLQKFDLGNSTDTTLRIIDQTSPIAKGSRAIVISPPRAGKTVLLEKFAVFFAQNKSLRTLLFLVDERPEEITYFKRLTSLPIFSSSMDQDPSRHIKLADLLVKNVRQEVESGNDVVLLIDSLTRLGRAHNLNDRKSGSHILSGGLGSSALQIPRKLFGLARNIEGGGSCTIIATILHETGSRLDDVIFQEFKGTGNCEIVLDRDLAEMRIFPAIDIKQSGTRNEELFRFEDELDKINQFRRELLRLDKYEAMKKMIISVENM
ncbi:MAG: transcription termination factor Rho [Candidatus Cloacimonetes bacterium]|nr:transcription termination factor Rho [Candidatus Cloacimonadota bacterium]